MISRKLIVNELLVRGATQRLEELNKERDLLLKLIERNSTVKRLKLKTAPKKRKKLHWTQLPGNKKKMLENIKRMQRAKSK